MNEFQLNEVAHRVVAAIIEDLKDRRGIGDEFDSIDEVTQRVIRREWRAIVINEVKREARP